MGLFGRSFVAATIIDGDEAEWTDILGNGRYNDPSVTDTGDGSPTYVDMGAYEYQGS